MRNIVFFVMSLLTLPVLAARQSGIETTQNQIDLKREEKKSNLLLQQAAHDFFANHNRFLCTFKENKAGFKAVHISLPQVDQAGANGFLQFVTDEGPFPGLDHKLFDGIETSKGEKLFGRAFMTAGTTDQAVYSQLLIFLDPRMNAIQIEKENKALQAAEGSMKESKAVVAVLTSIEGEHVFSDVCQKDDDVGP